MGPKAGLLGLLLALVFSASASATTLDVQAGGTDDPSSGALCPVPTSGTTYTCATLRDAVTTANSLGGDPTIQLGAGTFTLAGIDVQPVVPMTITGAGDMGSGASTITGGGINAYGDTAITVSDLELTGGWCGGILGVGSVTVTRVTVTGERCAYSPATSPGETGIQGEGAAILTYDGTLTLTDSVITDNVSIGQTGGVADSSDSGGSGGDAGSAVEADTLVMSGTVISGNTATGGTGGSTATGEPGGDGGRVTAAGVSVDVGDGSSISSSVITGNVATGGGGGAAAAANAGGSAGSVLGGGLYIKDQTAGTAPMTITGSTISFNDAEAGKAASNTAAGGAGGNAAYAGGGGLYAAGTFPLQISDTTINGNDSLVQPGGQGSGSQVGLAGSAEGGGMYLQFGIALTAVNATIANNLAAGDSGSGTPGTIGAFGGGIDFYGAGAAELASDTISSNSVEAPGGALFGANVYANATHVTFADTALANLDQDPAPGCATQSAGAFVDGSGNYDDAPATSGCGVKTPTGASGLSGPVAANRATGIAATATTPAIPAPPTLAFTTDSPLRGSGGTCLNPLMAGSPALTIDERGFARGGGCSIGAFEPQPVTATGAPVITGAAEVGQTLTCANNTFAASGDGAPDAGGAVGAPALSYSWTSGSSQVATTQTYTVAAGDRGEPLQCRVTATGYGTAENVSPSVYASAATVTPTSTKLALTGLSQTHKTWAEKKRKHGPPVGTTFTYSLNASATVTLEFRRLLPGRAVHGHCVARTRRNAGRHRCTRDVSAGTLKVASGQGPSSFPFTGKVGRRRLKPGKYSVVVTATTEGATTAPQTLTFTVKK